VEKHEMGGDSSNVVELPVGRGPGERLRAARTAAGLTLQAVADDLHLGVDVLEALERDDYAKMPGRVFVRGYLRKYARLVDLPADALLATFDAHVPVEDVAVPVLHTVVSARQIRSQARSSHSAVRAVTWIVVLVLAALLLTWWQGYLQWPVDALRSGEVQGEATVIVLPGDTVSPAMQRDVAPLLQDEKVAVAPAADRPLPQAPAASASTPTPAEPAPAPAAPVPPIVLELGARSWVEVLDSSGTFKLNGTFEKGFRKTFEGQPPYRISIGNLNAARLSVGGKAVDLQPHFNGRLVRLTLDPRETRPQ
jgi:cytoskeleton protein RodZ